MTDDARFNAHHSPLGAFATLTLGQPGAKGGLGMALSAPSDCPVFVGVYWPDEKRAWAFPFFDAAAGDEGARYEVEQAEAGAADEHSGQVDDGSTGWKIESCPWEEVTRTFGMAIDRWQARGLTLEVSSPVRSAVGLDAGRAQAEEAYLPAVFLSLAFDGPTEGAVLFLGTAGADPYTNFREVRGDGWAGFAQGERYSVVGPGAVVTTAFSPEKALELAPGFMLGNYAFIARRAEDLAGGVWDLSAVFSRRGPVTTGLAASAVGDALFSRLEQAQSCAVRTAAKARDLALAQDEALARALPEERRRRLLAHAVRSYQAATEALVQGAGEGDSADEATLLWVVNEGEYRMMNTFDLFVDHLFYELDWHPDMVRRTLELFGSRYAYEDRVRFPGEEHEYPGGVSFTHDMGVGDQFSPPEFSAYERPGLTGCFSYMTHEQLTNYTLCLLTYAFRQGELEIGWAVDPGRLLESFVNRDHPEELKRNGVMGLDSSRCAGGAEITTYDSLDVSLGQARNNCYLAVKTWAAYVMLERWFRESGRVEEAAHAWAQALRAAATVESHQREDGTLPAVFEPGGEATIIPAIEGLAFPLYLGWEDVLAEDGEFGGLVRVLREHFHAAMASGKNRFADGGWKLSSTSDNSWMSKIFLCQWVAERLWGYEDEGCWDAHWAWVTRGENGYWCFSDQIVAGVAKGSRYYPRGVTAWLWAREGWAREWPR